MYNKLKKEIFKINSGKKFNEMALEIFRFQSRKNPVYKNYIEYLNVDPLKIETIDKIPFLPIEFFKTKRIITNFNDLNDSEFKIFKSSGTTGINRSNHFVYDIDVYEKSFFAGFKQFFGNIEDFIIIGLLPSYLKKGNSSLIYMVEKLIKASKNENSGFYIDKLDNLNTLLIKLNEQNKKVVLFGVTYALLDLAEIITNNNFNNLIIIETGGMKGRRKELTRDELHLILKKAFNLKHIYSEYGMTELLSQAYLKENGLFYPSKTMKIKIRDINDPFSYLPQGKTGGINIIDLANIFSCSFIETKDLGKTVKSGFEVLGRFDDSDIRGCNLLIS